MKRSMKSWIRPAVLTLAAAAFLVPPVHAQGRVRCLAPSGGDDTEALQAALDRCSGARGSCRVSLCEGVFHTTPLRVGDFHGTLRGAGAGDDGTVIEALPDLAVNPNLEGYWQDDPLESPLPWPYLLQFVGGEGTVRDLAIRVPSPPEEGLRPTQGWVELFGVEYELAGAILVTGRSAARFDVTRVRIVAEEDPASFFETTLLAGVAIRGLILDEAPQFPSDFPVLPIQGRHRVSRSVFDGMLTGVALGELGDADVIVRGNETSAFVGVDLLDANRSRVRVFGNSWGVDALAVNALLNIDGAPSHDNRIEIHDNRGAVGPYFGVGEGILFWDPWILPEIGTSTVLIYDNVLEVGYPDEPAFAGIELVGARRAWVSRNTLRGRVEELDGFGGMGVGIDETAGCWALLNDFRGLETGAGPDLYLGLETRDCLAVIRRQDSFLDEGTDNTVLRLWW
jgi:hypothetical protein